MPTFTPEQELKFVLTANGIAISPDAQTAWNERFEGPYTLAEYASTGGLALKIQDGQDGIYANAHPIPLGRGDPKTQAKLRHAGGFLVEYLGNQYPADVFPVPAFHNQTYVDENGIVRQYTNAGVTHTDRIRVSPVAGCGMFCHFCNLPYELEYQRKPKDLLLDVINRAKDDPQTPARHVLISGGTPRPEDEPWEDDLYEFICHESPLPVDIMMTPREDPGYLRRLARAVNILSINIEVFDEARARKLIPSKAKRFGRDFYLDYIEQAVQELGVGRVQSLILFGREAIESTESTLNGVKELVRRGCIPVLSHFSPDGRTPMRNNSAPGIEEMREVYGRTLEICADLDTGVMPGTRCVACHHNVISFSDGSPFYIGENDDIKRPVTTPRQAL